jgi:hypothetical protein
MNTNIPPISTTINYSVDQTKDAINKVRLSVKPADSNGFYSTNTNDIFGVYDFNIHYYDSLSGNVFGTMTVAISDANDNKTNITVSSISKTNGALDNSRCSQIQSHFLNLLSSYLEGKDTNEVIQKHIAQTPDYSSEIAVIMIIIVVAVITLLAMNS